MEEKDEDLIKKFIRGGFTSDNINWMDVQSSAVMAAIELQKEIDRYNISIPSSHSFDAMIDDDEVSNKVLNQIDDDLTNTILTKDLIDDLIAKINANTKPSPTPPKDDTYILTKDGAYFVYWLMMNYDFILDKGFQPTHQIVHRALLSGGGWSRHIIKSGIYNETDRLFLNEIKEWLNNFGWVYRKPQLNEHNDLFPYIEKLPVK